MCDLNDELCREYGLHVYEKPQKGHRSYGEYISPNSWKMQLAEDVARCTKASSSLPDFQAMLWQCGIGWDIGKKSILFTEHPGTYGLKDERKCSNWKLMSYGDFTSENLMQTIGFNGFVLEQA